MLAQNFKSADALDISNAELAALIKVLGMLERCELVDVEQNTDCNNGFNIGTQGKGCGTPLRRVWMMTPRPSMPPGHVITAGGKITGGKMDYCWLVWEAGYEGEAEIKWLRRDGALPNGERDHG